MRLVARGKASLRMSGNEWRVKYGDIFIASPGVSFELIEDKEDPLEWYEMQLDGPSSSEILGLTGCSIDIPVMTVSDPVESIRCAQVLHGYYSLPARSPCRALGLFYLLLDRILPRGTGAQRELAQPEILAFQVKTLLDNSFTTISQNIETLAGRFDIDRSTLFRSFKKVTGQSPKAYLQNVRIRRAQELLMSTTMTVSSVAQASGFSNSKYFINVFRKACGQPPEKWRSEKVYKHI